MSAILNSVIPLFTVILAGFVAARARMLDQKEVRGLTNYVFFFALPPLLFRLMATNEVGSAREWLFFFVYLGSEVVMFGLGAAFARLLFGRGLGGATILGFAAAFSNTVLLGLPLVLWLYGDAGAVPALLVITVNVINFSLITILLELARGQAGTGSARRILADTGRGIVRNPIIMAAALGLAYGQLGLGLPQIVDETLGFMGRAGAPAALFALGATLAMQRVGGTLAPAAMAIILKLAIHPLLVWLLCVPLFGFAPLWANTGVIIAALPIGLNVFIFAQRYQVEVESTSSAILISTAISLATTTLVIALLPPVS